MLTALILTLVPALAPQASAALGGPVHLVRRGVTPERGSVHPDLRSALAAAADGDLVLLDPGLYTGPGNRDLVVTRDVEIRGRHGSASSLIDCEGAARAFDLRAGAVRLEGLTIRRGRATSGGGVLVSTGPAVLEDVVFESCFASSGGGVSSAPGIGLTLLKCRFARNRALSGGGAVLSGASQLIGCLFEANRATQIGGGLLVETDLFSPERVDVLRCEFRGNAGERGGGVTVFVAGVLALDGCVLVGNESQVGGGGILFTPLLSSSGVLFLTNSIVSGNLASYGAGGVQGSPAWIAGCTIVGNRTLSRDPGGIRSGSLAAASVVLNCILRDNRSTADQPLAQQIQESGGIFTPGDLMLLFSNVEGIAGDATSFDLDPLFADPAAGDWHLSPGSPCVDAGLAFTHANLELDLDGQPRFQGPSVDIGADELPR